MRNALRAMHTCSYKCTYSCLSQATSNNLASFTQVHISRYKYTHCSRTSGFFCERLAASFDCLVAHKSASGLWLFILPCLHRPALLSLHSSSDLSPLVLPFVFVCLHADTCISTCLPPQWQYHMAVIVLFFSRARDPRWGRVSPTWRRWRPSSLPK